MGAATGYSMSNSNSQDQPRSYPIASEVLTTVQRTVLPDTLPENVTKIYPSEVANFKEFGYGNWHYGPGLPHVKRLDLLPAGYNAAAATQSAKLLNFFTFTDIHISDKESPNQAILYGFRGGVSSGYSPVMLYTTHVLDAAVQTVNALHKTTPFDFGISLGDAANNTQYNELRWYIDVLDGKVITPSSGGHAGSDSIDYQKPFKAAGLDRTIPWYQALGNHDHFWIGTNPINDYLRQNYTGKDILNMGDIFTDPKGTNSRGFYMGAIDGSTPYGNILGVGPEKAFAQPPQVPAADPNRRSLYRNEWIGEYFNTSSNPKGHGFSQANSITGFASYTFEPKPDIPVRILVLDDTQREDDPNDNGYGHISIDQERYDWLISELDKGQAEGKLMIIAAHCPIGVTVDSGPGVYVGWSSVAAVTEAAMIAKLQTYPNFILWVAGHRHLNTITAFPSPDASRPELGFWEVETTSLRDWPQQFRTFNIIRNNDGTISIFATDVDPAVAAGSPAANSRAYAVAAQQIFKNDLVYLPAAAYNAELVKQLSPEMKAKLLK